MFKSLLGGASDAPRSIAELPKIRVVVTDGTLLFLFLLCGGQVSFFCVVGWDAKGEKRV
jgi:hypothetical protein